VVALHDPRDLHLRGRVDEQDQVEETLHPHLEKQRDVGQDDRLPVFPPDPLALALRLLEHGRVDDALQRPAAILAAEDEAPELLAVDPPAVVEDPAAEGLDDPRPDGPARLLQGMDEGVVIDDPRALFHEHPDHRRLARRDPPCQPHVQHRHASTTRAPFRQRKSRRSLAGLLQYISGNRCGRIRG